MGKLKQAYADMDVAGNGTLTWREFEDGLRSNPEACEVIGIGLETAGALFRQLDTDGSGEVRIESFFLGLVKVARASKSVDMLALEFEQRKVERALGEVQLGWTDSIDGIKQNVMAIQPDLKAIGEGLVAFDRHLISVEAASQSDDARLTRLEGDTTEGNLMNDMQRQYGFKDRLRQVQHFVAQANGTDDNFGAGASHHAHCAGVGGGATSIAERALANTSVMSSSGPAVDAIWSEIMNEEVLPWLRSALQKEATAKESARD